MGHKALIVFLALAVFLSGCSQAVNLNSDHVVQDSLEMDTALRPMPAPTSTPASTPTPTPTPMPAKALIPTAAPVPISKENRQVDYIYSGEGEYFYPDYNETVDKIKPQSQQMQEIVYKTLLDYEPKGDVGIYIKDMETGQKFTLNENKTKYYENTGKYEGFFRATSIIKLYMAVSVYELVETKELNIEETYYDQVTDEYFQINDSIGKMISDSDNCSYNKLLRLIGNDKLNMVIRKLGYESCTFYGELNPAPGYSVSNNIARHDTEIIGGRITLFETGKLIEFIYKNKDTNENIGFIHESMLNSTKTERIPSGINFKYAVANKTGTATDFGVFHDSAIIYSSHPIIIIVFTQNENPKVALGIIKQIAKNIVRLIEEYKDTDNPPKSS